MIQAKCCDSKLCAKKNLGTNSKMHPKKHAEANNLEKKKSKQSDAFVN